MILYSSRVSDFIADTKNNKISYILENMKQKELYEGTTTSEKKSWENSLKYMGEILNQSTISKDCTVSLEYNLPMTSSRIDLMLSGYDSEKKKKACKPRKSIFSNSPTIEKPFTWAFNPSDYPARS